MAMIKLHGRVPAQVMEVLHRNVDMARKVIKLAVPKIGTRACAGVLRGAGKCVSASFNGATPAAQRSLEFAICTAPHKMSRRALRYRAA
jgi:hypothetical protein